MHKYSVFFMFLYHLAIPASEPNPLVVILELESILLQSATIIATRSPFTFDGSKTTVNLSTAVTNSDGTMLDALSWIWVRTKRR